jgi:hypothetical protein
MMRYVHRSDGGAAIADDMRPDVRAFAWLIEHANRRRADGLPLPCPCDECERNRDALVGVDIVVL